MDTKEDNLKPKRDRVSASLNELNELYSTLNDESVKCLKLPDQDLQFIRRMFTRSAFALIEGTLFRMKQTVIEASNLFGINLSKRETALLLEESYDLNDKGEPITKTQYIQLPKNLKFTFKTMAKVFDAKYDIKIDDNGWAAFLEAIRIRNRITHPKHTQDIVISDKEMDVLREAILWFGNSLLELLKCARVILENKNSQNRSQSSRYSDA